jgi:hypothetical protein
MTEQNAPIIKMSELLLAIKVAISEGNEPQLNHLLEKIDAGDCIDLALESAKAGQAKFLRHFHRLGFDLHEAVLQAALPHPECLRYVVSHLSERVSSDKWIIEACAAYHPIESISILQSAGWPLPPLLCQEAAKAGRLDVLEYAFRNGCPLDTPNTCVYGDYYSYIVFYILWSWTTVDIQDRIDCLAYAIQHGCALREEFCEEAVRLGDFHILRYLRENPYRHCPWNPKRILQTSVRGVIKDYIEYCLYDLLPITSPVGGVSCGEQSYACGKWGCVRCSLDHTMGKPRSLSL